MQKIISEILLDDVAFISAADHEIIDTVCGIDLHDVPQNRFPADFDHWLRMGVRFFADTGAVASSEDYCLHEWLLLSSEQETRRRWLQQNYSMLKLLRPELLQHSLIDARNERRRT